jgi:hypothetical protein
MPAYINTLMSQGKSSLPAVPNLIPNSASISMAEAATALPKQRPVRLRLP